MSRRTLACFAALTALAAAAPSLAETIAIVDARVVSLGQAGTLQSGTVVIRDGKIAAVGPNVAVPAGARVIQGKGRVVTPGFVAADSGLGAVEVGAVGDTNDLQTNSREISAAFDVSYGLNPDSVLLPVARLGGITRAITTPAHPGQRPAHKDDGESDFAGGAAETSRESLFAGQAAVIHLGQANDILVKAKVAQMVPLGDSGAEVSGGARGATFVALKEALQNVRFYKANRADFDEGDTRDLGLSRADLEALIPVVEGSQPLIVEVHRASDIRQALRLAREEKLKIILDGAEEGWRVADEIAAAGVPVVLNPLADLPSSFEVLGSTLENAARLDKAGVKVVIKGNEGAAHRAREMRYNAGNAVAHGMPWENAVRAISLNPAQVFGVADQFGSLDVGKDADVVIWDGDPLEPLTQPVAVFVKGAEQSLTSRPRMLAERYKDPASGPYPPAYRK